MYFFISLIQITQEISPIQIQKIIALTNSNQPSELEQQKYEYQEGSVWYNEKKQKICGHYDEKTKKRCRNPYQCRIHNPQQKCILTKDKNGHKKISIGKWKEEEHLKFLKCVREKGIGRWQEVSNMLGTRNPSQCQVHYFKLKEKLHLTDNQMQQYLYDQDYDILSIHYSEQKQQQTKKQSGDTVSQSSNKQQGYMSSLHYPSYLQLQTCNYPTGSLLTTNQQ